MDGYKVAMDGYEGKHGTKRTVDGYVGIGQRGHWMDDECIKQSGQRQLPGKSRLRVGCWCCALRMGTTKPIVAASVRTVR